MNNITGREVLRRERHAIRRKANRHHPIKRYVFDVWHSDGNDRTVVGTEIVGSRDGEEEAGWDALDQALSHFTKVPDDWEKPYDGPIAVTDYHSDNCECSCHHFEHEPECPTIESDDFDDCTCTGKLNDYDQVDQDSGCDECIMGESLSIESCPYGGRGHYSQHADVR